KLAIVAKDFRLVAFFLDLLDCGGKYVAIDIAEGHRIRVFFAPLFADDVKTFHVLHAAIFHADEAEIDPLVGTKGAAGDDRGGGEEGGSSRGGLQEAGGGQGWGARRGS